MDDLFAPGLTDEEYERGDVPMTKREVRAVTLAYARVWQRSRVLDIGAGTGGLTVEFARACPAGVVVAVERDETALELLAANAENLAPGNVEIVPGEAPEVLASLDGPFDCVLVGGHGGRLAAVLSALPPLMAPRGRLVMNFIGLGAATAAWKVLSESPWSEPELAQVSIARAEPIGTDLRFAPLNPVFVVAARLES